MKKIKNIRFGTTESEKGQSIVIIAGAMLVLLGMVGLVIDLGVVYVRDSQLRSAVDAAALAGVTELSSGELADADQKAVQFMFANGLPTDSVLNLESDKDTTDLGAVQYTVTATWTVDLYFMTLFTFETVDLEKSATAAYFPLTDIYASTRVSDGALAMTTQSVFGPQSCTRMGDAYSPLSSPDEPGIYTYRYRIYIPPTYEADSGESVVRVELFDPDSINQQANNATMIFSDFWRATTGATETTRAIQCFADGGSGSRASACIIPTCEWDGIADDGSESTLYRAACGTPGGGDEIVGATDEDAVNLFWYIRVDENRTPACIDNFAYDPVQNTATQYSLYYFRELADGSLLKTNIASYTGQTGAPSIDITDSFDHMTDIHWVSPGALNPGVPIDPNATGPGESFSVDGNPQPFVPTDCDSPNGGDNSSDGLRCPGGSEPGESRGFEVDLGLDTPGIAQEDLSIGGARYLYLDVTALSGASENGYEIYAGPPTPFGEELSANANDRNVEIANERADGGYYRTSHGIVVFAMGVLPNNSVTTFQTDLPLIYVPPSYAGREINVDVFDFDSFSEGPITFYFDTISRDDFEFVTENTCEINCNDQWLSNDPDGITRGITFSVPQYDSELCTDPTDPNLVDVCTPFYGGVLTANYLAGEKDTSVWEATLPSLPYLTR